MSNMLVHKGYLGKVEFDPDAMIFHGEVINIRDVVTFQGSTPQQIKTAFCDSVEDYLAFCKDRGESPEKPFSGNFVVRLGPDLHRQVAMVAIQRKKSLNAFVKKVIQDAVARGARKAKPPSGRIATVRLDSTNKPVRKKPRRIGG